jgi:ribonucleoside-diphosphate reductase alpha chain
MSDFRKTDASFPEPSLTPNSITVLKDRYLMKNDKGENVETPKDLFYRVAACIAEEDRRYSGDIEKTKRTFYDMMATGTFLPNSPCLMNAGLGNGNLYGACYVLPIEDSIDGIFDTVKATALVQKAGGGTGFSFDRLRPTGDFIKSSGGTTSGPLSFWRVLYETTNAIQQGSKRRGANMGMMSINHPDILKFITAKQDLTAFTNYNISVKISDQWMDEYKKNPDSLHIVKNFRTGSQYLIPKDITGPKIMKYEVKDLVPYVDGTGYLTSVYWTKREVFSIILNCAWKTGEPGLFFIDKANKYNPTPHIADMEATNPCGEQPLLPYESCNLGSINVAKFVVDSTKSLDWAKLKTCVWDAVHFLDNVVDASPYPIPEITRMCQGNRKIGLGIMGFADVLFMLGIPYDSERGLNFGRDLMKFINDESLNASEALANVRGNFPYWSGSLWSMDSVLSPHSRKMRNAVATTVAPTGTISIIADCSGGMEPLFSLAFERNVLGGKKLLEANKHFDKIAKDQGFYSTELLEKIVTTGTVKGIDAVPSPLQAVFACSQDIAPEWHVRMQAAFQENCGSSISKTINLANSATKEDVEKAYLLAYDLECKGITVYRDGCRNEQPMALKKEVVVEKPKEREHVLRRPMKTPDISASVRIRQKTPFGHMHVNVTVDPVTGHESEVFAQLGKAGDTMNSDLEAITRLASLYLRLGGSVVDIIDQLEGIGSNVSIPTKEGTIGSIADALARALKKFREARNNIGLKDLLLGAANPHVPAVGKNEDKLPVKETETYSISKRDKCPECGAKMQFKEKCQSCQACGYSKCS